MAEEKKSSEKIFFEDVVKKTKTGVTFPKSLRDELFGDDETDIYFKLIVPERKDRIILEILSEEQAISIKGTAKKSKPKTTRTPRGLGEPKRKTKKNAGPVINWGEVFIYDYDNKDKVQPILESAFIKFQETPINLEDAMGRVKYALISFLSSTSTENAKLYYSVERFLIQIIKLFSQSDIIEFIFEKIVPQVKSKFLYELALLDLVAICLEMEQFEKAHTYIFYVLKNIDEYPKSEIYNIMNSFKQLVKTIKTVERNTGIQRSENIDILLKEKLREYGEGVEEPDYKIQIVEFLEDLNYIEMAYNLAKEIQMTLPPESIKLEEVRKLVKRLHQAPITEQKDDEF
ncbi:MAG: hypothetical protein ACTSR8_12630 [Promethearchaeota archaeon]